MLRRMARTYPTTPMCSGDLLARVIGDVEALENFYVRVISPSLTAIVIAIGVSIFFASFYPTIAFVLIIFFLTLGLTLLLLFAFLVLVCVLFCCFVMRC